MGNRDLGAELCLALHARIRVNSDSVDRKVSASTGIQSEFSWHNNKELVTSRLSGIKCIMDKGTPEMTVAELVWACSHSTVLQMPHCIF